MRQPRYRELRFGLQIKKNVPVCRVCKKTIDLGKVLDHLECGRKVIRDKEGK